MNAEQRRLVRQARDARQRQRLARAHAQETTAARADRYEAEAEASSAAPEHVPHLPVSELQYRVPGMGNVARHGNRTVRRQDAI